MGGFSSRGDGILPGVAGRGGCEGDQTPMRGLVTRTAGYLSRAAPSQTPILTIAE
jgi:hypothetical protein